MNPKQTLALNNAKPYFLNAGIKIKNLQYYVMKFFIGNNAPPENAAQVLADAMMAGMSFYNAIDRTTIWLEVSTPEIHSYVLEALALSTGLGVVLTMGDHCSHSSNTFFNDSLYSPMSVSQRSGFVWHPLQEKLVGSRPEWIAKAPPIK